MAKITALSEILARQYYFVPGAVLASGCVGCGGGIVAQTLARAVDRIAIPKDDILLVFGVHCSGTQASALDYNQLNGLHGRPLGYATGAKLFRPELTVISIQGDGDCVVIGGNHFIHAARRNIDITTIICNNFIFGRTGGQSSATTPTGAHATSAPYGVIDRPFDVCKLAEAAGATFVARGTTYHAVELIDIIEKAIRHRGFSVVEVFAQCPTSFGRQNRNIMGGERAVNMMKWMRDCTISVDKAGKASEEDKAGKILTGIFVDKDAPEYTEQYWNTVKTAQGVKER
jgi:2-oxoglutarate/2-oxoacid ferredoxin oxidoreductase subunit beta